MHDDWAVLLVGSRPFEGRPPLSETHLAKALARTRPVLVVDPPRSRWRRDNRDQVELVVLDDGSALTVFRPRTLPAPDRSGSVVINDVLIARQVNRAARQWLGNRRRVIVSFSPHRGLLPRVDHDLFVYWQYDRVADIPGLWARDTALARHQRLLHGADIVTGVSTELVDECAGQGVAAELITNGVDLRRFETQGRVPPELKGRHPVIGFVGAIGPRVDVDLVADVARARPDAAVVLIGPQRVDLPDLPNLLVVGSLPYDELSDWVANFSVGLVPYRTDRFNRSSSPLKAFEYLAAGVPVVSTPLPALDGLGPTVTVAPAGSAFLAAVDRAIEEPVGADSCRRAAAGNTWEHRAEQLTALIDARLHPGPGAASPPEPGSGTDVAVPQREPRSRA
ncbi:MAG: glycosyltransferase family 1 protein [Actinomycetia bacterium]|nr:glycosyltransferase family 1 protein [Actinomycetes bacterium]